ncbi:sialidase family protein [Stieleria sedimenti]|uniref:sialidase family protein n=1 Tax=Stieleria sedimenti TaxID=2976331 RepID=UPI00217FF812|nr:sialidase family protein [Stieleria sedimenti]
MSNRVVPAVSLLGLSFTFSLCAVSFSAVPVAAEEPMLDKTDLFTAGQAGYETFRVPGIAVAQKGTVLAYCEARRGSRSDWADIETLLCRSTNGGRTGSPPQRIADNDSTFLFTNPDSHENHGFHGKNKFRHRENVTVRMSFDDCETWPVSRVLEPGVSGYTDLAVGKDGTIYCVYERGGDDGFAHKHLTMARFNREWLEGQR